MSALNCIIVDDDQFSTRIMSSFVSRTESVNLEKTFANAIEAVNFLSRPESNSIDVIFLDIEMPEMSGIEFLQAIDLKGKEVVIYSSQEKYALESYEYDVCDYLLKPVNYARFIKAIAKVKLAFSKRESQQESQEAGNSIFLKDNYGQVHKVNFADIAYIEAMENYVLVATTQQKIIVHVAMKKLMDVFPEEFIVRTHRSYAIGLRYIEKASVSEIEIRFQGEQKSIPVSRSYRAEVKKILGQTTQWCE